jgi:hypothetical protein
VKVVRVHHRDGDGRAVESFGVAPLIDTVAAAEAVVVERWRARRRDLMDEVTALLTLPRRGCEDVRKVGRTVAAQYDREGPAGPAEPVGH